MSDNLINRLRAVAKGYRLHADKDQVYVVLNEAADRLESAYETLHIITICQACKGCQALAVDELRLADT